MKNTNGDWFGCRLIFECYVANERGRLVEDRIVLVKARTEEEARQKSAELAVTGVPERYKNVYGQDVEWRFREVLGVRQLVDSFSAREGAEVYSTIMGADEFERLRDVLEGSP